jgi:hypothetical protein
LIQRRFGLRQMANAAGLAAITAVYWLIVALLRDAPVVWLAWAVLYAVCLLLGLGAWRVWRPEAGVRFWAVAAFRVLLLAGIFYGANGGLDALYGSDRQRARVEAGLGGMELWFVLCPGLFSVAVGSALRAAVLSRRALRRSGRP